MEHSEYFRKGISTAVLFIHGFLGSPSHFKDMMPLVPDTWTVHNLLLDGHGKEIADFSASSMEKWKAQAAKASDELCKTHENVIIAAHSMGTFFAIDAAIRSPEKIKALFLLASPLKIAPKPPAAANAFKLVFDRISPDDASGIAARKACSIKTTKKLWQYSGWVPRYLELFKECRTTRDKVRRIRIPCRVLQSAKDELVSRSSSEYFKGYKNISLSELPNSMHFYYDKSDYEYLLSEFKAVLENVK